MSLAHESEKSLLPEGARTTAPPETEARPSPAGLFFGRFSVGQRSAGQQSARGLSVPISLARSPAAEGREHAVLGRHAVRAPSARHQTRQRRQIIHALR